MINITRNDSSGVFVIVQEYFNYKGRDRYLYRYHEKLWNVFYFTFIPRLYKKVFRKNLVVGPDTF